MSEENEIKIVLFEETTPKSISKASISKASKYYVPTGTKPSGRPKTRTEEDKALLRVKHNKDWRERRGNIVLKINYNIKKCKEEGYELPSEIKELKTESEQELLAKYTAVLNFRATNRASSIGEKIKNNYTEKGINISKIKTQKC
mgnify:CR=1 FL=1